MNSTQKINYILERYEQRYKGELEDTELSEYKEYLSDLHDEDLQREIDLFED